MVYLLGGGGGASVSDVSVDTPDRGPAGETITSSSLKLHRSGIRQSAVSLIWLIFASFGPNLFWSLDEIVFLLESLQGEIKPRVIAHTSVWAGSVSGLSTRESLGTVGARTYLCSIYA